MKPVTMYMAAYKALAPFYGIHHRRRDLVKHLDFVQPKWREFGMRVVRVTVSQSEGRT